LVTLLWHNDCFNEPEYREWQWTYEQLLSRLAARRPWCATGAEIAAWWRKQSAESRRPSADGGTLGHERARYQDLEVYKWRSTPARRIPPHEVVPKEEIFVDRPNPARLAFHRSQHRRGLAETAICRAFCFQAHDSDGENAETSIGWPRLAIAVISIKTLHGFARRSDEIGAKLGAMIRNPEYGNQRNERKSGLFTADRATAGCPHMTAPIASIVVNAAWWVAPAFSAEQVFLSGAVPAGWLMLLANVRLRNAGDQAAFPPRALGRVLWLVATGGAGCWLGGAGAAVVAVVLGGAWVWALRVELRWRADAPARQQADCAGRVPLPIPRLIVTLRGPVLRRGRRTYRAGVLPEGWSQPYELLILNPGIVRPQLPLRIELATASTRVRIEAGKQSEWPCPEPGQVVAIPFALRGERAGRGGDVRLRVAHGDWTWTRRLRVAAVPARGAQRVRNAAIRRWKYGARAGFVWRGDNDLYDPATFQSAAGLRLALGLAARFRMPTTVMLSSRLSLHPDEHAAFCNISAGTATARKFRFNPVWREEGTSRSNRNSRPNRAPAGGGNRQP
jgi:hypothetical protein